MKKLLIFPKNWTEKILKLPIQQRRVIGVSSVALIVALIATSIVLLTRHRTPGLLQLSSPAFSSNKDISALYTCDGENINPPLDFSHISTSTKSLALLMEDTTDKAHPISWILWNIPASNPKIMEGIRPAGTVARSFAGNFGYSGPCPPAGETHTYTIHLYALSAELLSINSGATLSDFQSSINKVLIDEADLQMKYRRAAK